MGGDRETRDFRCTGLIIFEKVVRTPEVVQTRGGRGGQDSNWQWASAVTAEEESHVAYVTR